jgi:hypothetical protein
MDTAPGRRRYHSTTAAPTSKLPVTDGTRGQTRARVSVTKTHCDDRFTGTRCPRFTFPGGTGKPTALRGGMWSDPLRAVTGQALCPGTYHVAVSVMDHGRPGNPTHSIKAFGTATFTVRP